MAADPEAARISAQLAALREIPEYAGHPLLRELEALAQKHLLLLRRMGKLTRISDGFQGQLKELNQSLQRASRTDFLTAIPNRRAMMDSLHGERLRSLREGAPMAVVMADVDRFKTVNDTRGHEAGDRLLHALGQTLGGALRAYDLCCRWGGEEFLVLLPGTDRAGALEVAEKLRRAVAGLTVETSAGPLSVTVSLGLAMLGPEDTLDSLLRRADEAMYEAKRRGGDQVAG